MDWIYFKNPETGGTFEAPVQDGVRERYEALGWVEVDRPEEVPFVPAPTNTAPGVEDTEWVTLHHPQVGADHQFPNNASALAGAQEAGWEYPAPQGTGDTEPEPEKPKATKKTAKQQDDTVRPAVEEGE